MALRSLKPQVPAFHSFFTGHLFETTGWGPFVQALTGFWTVISRWSGHSRSRQWSWNRGSFPPTRASLSLRSWGLTYTWPHSHSATSLFGCSVIGGKWYRIPVGPHFLLKAKIFHRTMWMTKIRERSQTQRIYTNRVHPSLRSSKPHQPTCDGNVRSLAAPGHGWGEFIGKGWGSHRTTNLSKPYNLLFVTFTSKNRHVIRADIQESWLGLTKCSAKHLQDSLLLLGFSHPILLKALKCQNYSLEAIPFHAGRPLPFSHQPPVLRPQPQTCPASEPTPLTGRLAFPDATAPTCVIWWWLISHNNSAIPTWVYHVWGVNLNTGLPMLVDSCEMWVNDTQFVHFYLCLLPETTPGFLLGAHKVCVVWTGSPRCPGLRLPLSSLGTPVWLHGGAH